MAKQLTTSPADVHRVQSTLVRMGVTFQGAQQLATGQPVINPADRQAIASILNDLLTQVAQGAPIKT